MTACYERRWCAYRLEKDLTNILYGLFYAWMRDDEGRHIAVVYDYEIKNLVYPKSEHTAFFIDDALVWTGNRKDSYYELFDIHMAGQWEKRIDKILGIIEKRSGLTRVEPR